MNHADAALQASQRAGGEVRRAEIRNGVEGGVGLACWKVKYERRNRRAALQPCLFAAHHSLREQNQKIVAQKLQTNGATASWVDPSHVHSIRRAQESPPDGSSTAHQTL